MSLTGNISLNYMVVVLLLFLIHSLNLYFIFILLVVVILYFIFNCCYKLMTGMLDLTLPSYYLLSICSTGFCSLVFFFAFFLINQVYLLFHFAWWTCWLYIFYYLSVVVLEIITYLWHFRIYYKWILLPFTSKELRIYLLYLPFPASDDIINSIFI